VNAGTFRYCWGLRFHHARYDPANRLRLAWETNVLPNPEPTNSDTALCSGVSATSCLRFDFDSFGNAWSAEKVNTTGGLIPTTPNWYKHTTPSTYVDNRLELPAGAYDNAGNLLRVEVNDANKAAEYDAESRLTKVKITNTTPQTVVSEYRYDAEGRRVKRIVGSSTTYYIYGIDGSTVAEFQPNGTGSGTEYALTDHLGSTRVKLDATGNVLTRHDYEPFGTEIARTTEGYGSAESLRKLFTGKERDAETGLDYFGARYFSGAQGRFTSPDPFNLVDELVGQEFDEYLANPQYWNKYAYSLNNPLKYKDSDGALPHAVVGGLVGGGIGGALELYSQIRSGQDLNWAKVATKTGAGAAVGATAAATFGTSLLFQGFALSVAATGSGIADRALDNDASTQALDYTSIGADAVVGAVSGIVGGVVGKQVQGAVQTSAGQKLNERLADQAVRATAQRSASRQAGARELQKQVTEHPEKVGRFAAGPGRAAAKAGTTAGTQKAIEILRKRKDEDEKHQ